MFCRKYLQLVCWFLLTALEIEHRGNAVSATDLNLSICRTHFGYEDVRDRSNRLNADESNRSLAYVFSLEGASHKAHLRAIASSFYLLTLLLFLVSAFLTAVNIFKNKTNIQTNGGPYQPVAKAETVIYNDQRNAVSTKEDLPWIDQN